MTPQAEIIFHQISHRKQIKKSFAEQYHSRSDKVSLMIRYHYKSSFICASVKTMNVSQIPLSSEMNTTFVYLQAEEKTNTTETSEKSLEDLMKELASSRVK